MLSNNNSNKNLQQIQQLFQQTTQFKHWIYTLNQLQDIRRSRLEQSIEKTIKNIQEERLANSHQPLDKEEMLKIKDGQIITVQDQLDRCRLFEEKIMDFCKVFKFDISVQATAIIYFKRFYLKHTILDYEPKLILLTAIFLAAKVENQYIPLEKYLKKIPKAPDANDILQLEFELSKGIDFEFLVQHPYWALHGFFLDIQVYLQEKVEENNMTTVINSSSSSSAAAAGGTSNNNTGNVNNNPSSSSGTGGASGNSNTVDLSDLFKPLAIAYAKARDFIGTSYMTDIPFMFWPSQIALAALRASARNIPSDILNASGVKSFLSSNSNSNNINNNSGNGKNNNGRNTIDTSNDEDQEDNFIEEYIKHKLERECERLATTASINNTKPIQKSGSSNTNINIDSKVSSGDLGSQQNQMEEENINIVDDEDEDDGIVEGEDVMKTLFETLDSIESIVRTAEGQIPNKERAKTVFEKLAKFKNPENDRNSLLFLKRKQEKEQEEQLRKQQKLQENQMRQKALESIMD